MKIGIYATNNSFYPTPDDVIFANVTVAGELADSLAKLGEDVTFFAPLGTRTSAKLVSFEMLPFSNSQIYSVFTDKDASYEYEDLMMVRALNYMEENNFDIFNSHCRPLSVVKFAALKKKIHTVVTVHDPLYYPAYKILPQYNEFNNLSFISLTDAQRETLKELRWDKTIHNGIDLEKWPFNGEKGKYLLFVGRLMEEKGVDLAVEIARKARLPLKIAGSIYGEDKEFFNEKIKPHLNDKIEYLGLLPRNQLPELYGKALALLCPIRWPEPFGLVMIEAMACGTPVIASRMGSVPEIVEDQKMGIILDSLDLDAWTEAVKQVNKIDRKACRDKVETDFSLTSMAKNYVNLYQQLVTQ